MWLTTLGKELSVRDWMVTEIEAACNYLHNTALSILLMLHRETRAFFNAFLVKEMALNKAPSYTQSYCATLNTQSKHQLCQFIP